ncbi:MAG: HlyD family efflux transporter periplasmic adaptor subunit [Propionicimonas sp.]
MNRRRLVNAGLGVLVLGLGVAGILALLSPREDPYANLPTITVIRGTLAATVTASGNVESGVTALLQMPGAGGVITKVYVKTGSQVTVGDPLVKIDATAARQQFESALATLASAEAAMTNATRGRTAAEKGADAASVSAATQSLTNAERLLSVAEDNDALVRSQQAEILAAQQAGVDDAQQVLSDDQAELALLEAELAATDPSDTDAVAELQTRITALEAQLAADASSLATAEAALAQAERTRDSAVLQARQSVVAQRASRDSARKALAQAKATVAVAQQPPNPGTVQAAQAQISAASVGIDQARRALEDTVLRAPFSGTVSTVNAVVGQSSTSAGSTGGLITLVNPRAKRVTAFIAEADVASVEVGQEAAVNLPATGLDLTARVASVDVRSTVSDNVVQYLTTLSLRSPPDTVRVGQTASLSITTASVDDVLYVPTSAIATDGVTSSVIRISRGTHTRVEVTTGMTGTTGTEITSGLTEGDAVLLSNPGGPGDTGPFPTAGQSSAR